MAGETPDGDVPGIVSLTRRIDLMTPSVNFARGTEQAVLYVLNQMRAQMPYADTLVLRLECTRRPPP